MRDPNQVTRFNSQELALIKQLFADNEDLLSIVRKVMIQMELTESEKTQLQGMITETSYALLVKFFVPWLEADAPIGQLTHLALGLGAEIKQLSPEGAWPYIKAKELEMNYLSQQLQVLKGSEEKPTIILNDLTDLDVPKTQREQKYIEVMAWNWLIQYIEQNVAQIRALAGRKDETPDETLERLKKMSAK